MPTKTATPRLIGATVLSFLIALATAALIAPAASLAAPEGGAQLTFSPASLNFPKTTVGNQSPAQELVVTNEGEAETWIESVSIEGGDASQFNLGWSNCNTPLYSGQKCTLSIGFVPSGVGDKQATAVVRFDGTQIEAVLEGSSVAPQLQFSPPSHDFGVQWVHSGSDAWLQLANAGEAAVQVNNLDIVGDSSIFGTGSSDCWGRWLQPGETCGVQVWFNPQDTVGYSAQLRASSNSYSFTADLSGTGGRAILETESNPVAFGPVPVGAEGATRAITLVNHGNLPGAFFIAVIAGGDAGSFDLLDESCTAAPVMPGASCTVNVRFDPQSAGARSARFALFGEGDGGTMVMLSGEGVAPIATLAPAGLDFGRQAVGTRSSGHYLTVANDGSAPLKLDGAAIVGADLDQFLLAGDACTGTVVAPGDECLLRIRFAPDSTGTKTATLRVAGGAGVLTASLRGIAVSNRGTVSSAVTYHSRRKRHRFRHGAQLSVAGANCQAHRCRVAVSRRLRVKGG